MRINSLVFPVGVGYAPEGRSRDLAKLVAGHPELKDATVIADPDYLVEPLSYYMSNPTYLMREGRFGNIVTFTRKARPDRALRPYDLLFRGDLRRICLELNDRFTFFD